MRYLILFYVHGEQKGEKQQQQKGEKEKGIKREKGQAEVSKE